MSDVEHKGYKKEKPFFRDNILRAATELFDQLPEAAREWDINELSTILGLTTREEWDTWRANPEVYDIAEVDTPAAKETYYQRLYDKQFTAFDNKRVRDAAHKVKALLEEEADFQIGLLLSLLYNSHKTMTADQLSELIATKTKFPQFANIQIAPSLYLLQEKIDSLRESKEEFISESREDPEISLDLTQNEIARILNIENKTEEIIQTINLTEYSTEIDRLLYDYTLVWLQHNIPSFMQTAQCPEVIWNKLAKELCQWCTEIPTHRLFNESAIESEVNTIRTEDEINKAIGHNNVIRLVWNTIATRLKYRYENNLRLMGEKHLRECAFASDPELFNPDSQENPFTKIPLFSCIYDKDCVAECSENFAGVTNRVATAYGSKLDTIFDGLELTHVRKYYTVENDFALLGRMSDVAEEYIDSEEETWLFLRTENPHDLQRQTLLAIWEDIIRPDRLRTVIAIDRDEPTNATLAARINNYCKLLLRLDALDTVPIREGVERNYSFLRDRRQTFFLRQPWGEHITRDLDFDSLSDIELYFHLITQHCDQKAIEWVVPQSGAMTSTLQEAFNSVLANCLKTTITNIDSYGHYELTPLLSERFTQKMTERVQTTQGSQTTTKLIDCLTKAAPYPLTALIDEVISDYEP